MSALGEEILMKKSVPFQRIAAVLHVGVSAYGKQYNSHRWTAWRREMVENSYLPLTSAAVIRSIRSVSKFVAAHRANEEHVIVLSASGAQVGKELLRWALCNALQNLAVSCSRCVSVRHPKYRQLNGNPLAVFRSDLVCHKGFSEESRVPAQVERHCRQRCATHSRGQSFRILPQSRGVGGHPL